MSMQPNESLDSLTSSFDRYFQRFEASGRTRFLEKDFQAYVKRFGTVFNQNQYDYKGRQILQCRQLFQSTSHLAARMNKEPLTVPSLKELDWEYVRIELIVENKRVDAKTRDDYHQLLLDLSRWNKYSDKFDVDTCEQLQALYEKVMALDLPKIPQDFFELNPKELGCGAAVWFLVSYVSGGILALIPAAGTSAYLISNKHPEPTVAPRAIAEREMESPRLHRRDERGRRRLYQERLEDPQQVRRRRGKRSNTSPHSDTEVDFFRGSATRKEGKNK